MATEKILHLISWNICGLKTPRNKLKSVQNQLDKLNTSIAFLQETRIGPNDQKVLENIPGWQSYFTVYKSNSRGVAILIKNDLLFKYLCHDEDGDGGYIVLFCQINGHTYTLVNVYKHKFHSEMLMRLAQYLQQTADGTLVIGGDFNGVLDPRWDRNHPCDGAKPDIHLSYFTSSLSVTDVWSTRYPTVTDFTYEQNDSSSRIDMFFMLPKDMNLVKTIRVQETNISDHKPLALELQQEDTPKPLQGKLKQVLAMLETNSCIKSNFHWKISGVEILMAINSLSICCRGTDNEHVIEKYRRDSFLKSEELKIKYNHLTKIRQSRSQSKDNLKCQCSTTVSSSVDHLVFAKVLETYTQAQLQSSFKHFKEGLGDTLYYIFLFKSTAQKICIVFLNTILKIGCCRDLTVISKLLADDPESEAHKLLLEGCPLTKTVLTLALKYLADHMMSKKYVVTLSENRCTLHVYGNLKSEAIKESIRKVKESGLDLIYH